MSDLDRDVERDHVLRRAVQTLRELPVVSPGSITRVVTAAAAERVLPAADEPPVVARSGGRPMRWRVAGVAALVAAAAVVGFIVRGPVAGSPPAGSAAAASGGASLRVAANDAADVVPVYRQFVFRSTAARHISLVGDFNRWNPTAAPMARGPGGDLWSVTVPIPPGRHTYGFMIDDSVFTLDPDPRAERARDPDLGVEGSVIVVGRP